MKTITVFSPAKINLFLAVTGLRADGYHDLVSVAAPLEWGDSVTIEMLPPGAGKFPLTCNDPAVPADESNLVIKAAQTFFGATRRRGGARFELDKRIPMGAGLGGGSSNAAAALRGLNEMAGKPLDGGHLAALAAQVGSDCALFLPRVPVVMRGRGERIEPIPTPVAARLRGRRVLVFKPDFGVATAWAYQRLAEAGAYLPAAEAEGRLGAWWEGDAPAEDLLFNGLETPVFAKYVALPALLDQLRDRFGLRPRMSGSGSACFALLPGEGGPPLAEVKAAIAAAWGASALVVETRLR